MTFKKLSKQPLNHDLVSNGNNILRTKEGSLVSNQNCIKMFIFYAGLLIVNVIYNSIFKIAHVYDCTSYSSSLVLLTIANFKAIYYF